MVYCSMYFFFPFNQITFIFALRGKRRIKRSHGGAEPINSSIGQ